ncbi:MAG: polysaccharide pyruvyl transferase family protein [Thiocapsa sp.]|uniref:polysaccharide pyruvyl transferase family protein n=1 Tax=Thiocapsa sp. TaxID=2024551 RepID=UPI001BCFD1B7|nr:polysaccharide pyruvyl transferase family protein [Thiocapsa sp.]QVL47853.1 MAG: polysaccharide pyruvyl transferase family protein [Thiocapsa sp.]
MLPLKYFQGCANAGDQFSLRLAEHFFGDHGIRPAADEALAEPNLVLLGSIISWADSNSYVCGAGLILPTAKPSAPPAGIHCVRGPLTAHFLNLQGIDCPARYADPGVLAPLLFPSLEPVRAPFGVLPHYVDRQHPWVERCRREGLAVIDPTQPLADYFSALQACEIILSSSLHGIIFAHAYGKPALWIELSNAVLGDGFKFHDYYLSIGIAPGTVRRIRIEEDTRVEDLLPLATTGSHERLVATIRESIDMARQALFEEVIRT